MWCSAARALVEGLAHALLPPVRPAVLQVLATQHNLPANTKRALQYSMVVPQPQRPQQAFVSRLPTELQSSLLHSLSPSDFGNGRHGIP
jgi:hypothetical protein